jgi:thiol:disulfide interchange protein DsbC
MRPISSLFALRGLARAAAVAGAALLAAALPLAACAEDAAPTTTNASAPPNAAAAPGASKAPAVKIGGAEANIRRLLEARLRPGTKIDGVTKSPFFGLYEARIGADLMYTDEKVTYIFLGSILDGKSLDNLTEERVNKLTAIKFEDLPFKDAIKLVNGNGKRQIAYFSDPNCPYCKQYERSLTQVKDATVYVFLYAILSEDSVTKAKALWCAPDRAKAWSDWMLRGQMVNSTACDNPIDSNHALGQRLNVKATPTTILSNGQRIPGAVPIAQIEKAIADAAQ